MKNEIHDPVVQNYYYDVIFVYDQDYDYKLVHEVEIDFDLDSQKQLHLKTTDSYDLEHNFGDVSLVILHIYDKTGIIQRREIFEVTLSKYNQKYGTDKSFDKSEIYLTFNISQYHITHSDDVDAVPIESWLRDWFRDRRIDDIIK